MFGITDRLGRSVITVGVKQRTKAASLTKDKKQRKLPTGKMSTNVMRVAIVA